MSRISSYLKESRKFKSRVTLSTLTILTILSSSVKVTANDCEFIKQQVLSRLPYDINKTGNGTFPLPAKGPKWNLIKSEMSDRTYKNHINMISNIMVNYGNEVTFSEDYSANIIIHFYKRQKEYSNRNIITSFRSIPLIKLFFPAPGDIGLSMMVFNECKIIKRFNEGQITKSLALVPFDKDFNPNPDELKQCLKLAYLEVSGLSISPLETNENCAACSDLDFRIARYLRKSFDQDLYPRSASQVIDNISSNSCPEDRK